MTTPKTSNTEAMRAALTDEQFRKLLALFREYRSYAEINGDTTRQLAEIRTRITAALSQAEQRQEAPSGFDAEFLALRLGRVAKLVGMKLPEGDHEYIAGIAGTILGQIASRLEQPQPSAVRPGEVLTDRGDAVNLARNLEAHLFSTNQVTGRGLEILCDAVLRMDAALSKLAENDDAHYKRLEALGWQAQDCKICGESMSAYARPIPELAEKREAVAWRWRNQIGDVVTQWMDFKASADDENRKMVASVNGVIEYAYTTPPPDAPAQRKGSV